MAVNIALVYYTNPDHYSVDEKGREWLIKEGYGELIGSAQVPVNVILLGSTLKEISKMNPPHIKRLNAAQKAKYIFSSYSHFACSIFRSDFDIQMKYGEKYIRKFINKDKLMDIYALPEYDVSPAENSHDSPRFNFMLCNSCILCHSSLKECNVLYKFQQNGQKYLCIHKNIAYRETIHKYFREECRASDVISALVSDYQTFSNPQLLVCAIDLELPIINRVHLTDRIVSPPRIDLFRRLLSAFADSDINFVYLDEALTNAKIKEKIVGNYFRNRVTAECSPHYSSLYRYFRENREILLKKQPFAYMECTTSDFFTHKQKALVLPAAYKNRKGKVIIRRSGLKKDTLQKKLKKLKVPYFN